MTADSLTPPDLELLLAGVARHDRRAFAELYEQTSPHLFAVLLRILKRRDWAEEALQDSYLRIWQRSETYSPSRGAPRTWLLSIARYRALDLLRMRRPEVSDSGGEDGETSVADNTPAPGADLPAQTQTDQQLARLQGCLEGLESQQRDSLLLAYYEGYTHSELARRMKTPLGTIKSWVRRGLQQLRDCLGVP